MNPKDLEMEKGYYGCMYFERRKEERKYTFEDMQNDMQKLKSDITSLEAMDIDCSIKRIALIELKDKKQKLLKQMHEQLDDMYS